MAEADELVTECWELRIKLPLLLVCVLVLPGGPQNATGCMLTGFHLAL